MNIAMNEIKLIYYYSGFLQTTKFNGDLFNALKMLDNAYIS